MTHSTVGGLWILDDDTGDALEVFNDLRASTYQDRHPLTRTVCVDCNCPILGVDPLSGDALMFGVTPDDGSVAPWHDDALSISDDFLGFLVTDITGLDYAGMGRAVNQRALDGANAAPMRVDGREITFTLIGQSLSEQAMRYGLDWLASRLSLLGGRCESGTILMRLYCPSSVEPDLDDGLVFLRGTSMKIGPTWTSNWLDGYGCLVRESMVTLIATEPCFYTATTECDHNNGVVLPNVNLSAICDGDVTVSQVLCGPIEPSALPLDASTDWTCEMAPEHPFETRAAGVTIQMTSGDSGPFMIEAYHAAIGADPNDVIGDPAAYLGRIGVKELSGTEGVLVDAVSQVVYFRPNTSTPWVPDDSLLLFPDEDFPFYPLYDGADSLFIAIRPYYVCSGSGHFNWTMDRTGIFGCPGS